jgi:F-type H+-transporting ATPase subunit b
MFDIQIPTFIFTILNFLALFWLLKKLLFKPVTEYMENRSRTIKDSLEEAMKERDEALRLKEQYESRLKNASADAGRIISEAKKQAEIEYKTIVSSAEKEAQAIINEARKSAEEERAKLMKELQAQVADLVISAAERIIEENMNTERNRRLVERFIAREGVS